MSKVEIALFFHILGAVLFLGGLIFVGVLFEAARRRAEPAEIALLLGVTRVGVVMVLSGAAMVLAFGLWLVDIEGIGFDAGWIQATLVLYLVSLVLGALGGRRPKEARLLATGSRWPPTTPPRRRCWRSSR
jgi:uncharacterized membrane protein